VLCALCCNVCTMYLLWYVSWLVMCRRRMQRDGRQYVVNVKRKVHADGPRAVKNERE
jgi:hypothetical protein